MAFRRRKMLNEKKYQNIILYFASQLGGEIRGKKKLAKLLYFADFDFFEKYLKSITGDTYKALPMGPFPVHMQKEVQALERAGKIKIEEKEERVGYNPTEIYRALEEPNKAVFDESEKAMLDRVIVKYGQLNGKQLEELTHAEAPYVGTAPSEEIAYELSLYRGTDFSEDA